MTDATSLRYRSIGIAVGLALAGAVMAAPAPEGLSHNGQLTGAVAVLMAVWWVGNVLPMAVTALVPLIAFPVLGVSGLADVAAPFAHHLIFLMFGGFVLGHAMEEVGLHRRLTAALLAPAWVRASPDRVVLALMVAAAVLSGLVSNTATMLMLLPLAMELARECTDDKRGRTAFVLCLAYAASIGGVSTLVGTPPNAVLASVVEESLGRTIGFGEWMRLGVPFVVLALPLAWLTVTKVALPITPRVGHVISAPQVGAWRRSEVLVVAVVLAAMGMWLLKPIPGLKDAWVAMGAAAVCMVLPADGSRGLLLHWRKVLGVMPWAVLLLLGGGFSLAATVKSSGLTAWAAGGVSALALLPTLWAVLAICLLMTFLTEVTSNTATTQIALPLLAAGALHAHVDPMVWMLPATISASCAFMMPVATAPNAIASQAGNVAPGDMARAGLLLNLLCVGVATGVSVASAGSTVVSAESASTQPANTAAEPVRTWIDVDCSAGVPRRDIDDAVALIQAFNSPELDILGVSTVFGNAPLSDTDPIAREVTRLFGPADLAVHRGASKAQEGDTPAVAAIISALEQAPLTVLALGPVTNVAGVVAARPDLAARMTVIAVAGRRPGQRFTTGTTNLQGHRDFNFEKDPGAFEVILASDAPLILTPWEVSSTHWITAREIEVWAQGSPGSQWLANAVPSWLGLWRDRFAVDGFNPFDTLAVGYLTHPTLFSCDVLPVAIEIHPNDVDDPAGPQSALPTQKPFLLTSKQLSSVRSATYCHSASSHFLDMLMNRLVQ